MRTLIVSILLGITFLTGSPVRALESMESAPASEFKLERYTPGGSTGSVTLNGLLAGGKTIILSFFDTSCEPCRKELPALEKTASNFRGSAEIYLVCLDEKHAEVLPSWLKSNPTSLPILLDPLGMRAGEKYGVTKYGRAEIPQVFVIGNDGTIKKRVKGYNPDLAAILATEINADRARNKTTTRPKDGTATLDIIYTNSANGYLESCDCPENPFGGLVRRITAVKRLKEKYPGAIAIDSGDFFPPRENTLLAEYSLKMMELAGYDAVGIGDQELICGSGFLKNNINRLPFISANLQTCDDKMCWPLTLSHIIKNAGEKAGAPTGGLKTAVISVINPAVFNLFPGEKIKDIKTTSYEEYLQHATTEMRDEAGAIILVSHCGDDTDREIAAAVPGIDVIVGGHSQTFHKEPMKIGSTLIVQAGENGQRVGHLTLKFGANGKIASYANEFVVLNKDVPDDPRARVLLEQYKTELKNSLKKIIAK
jgi:thiol-disulfide isomerase/thioredoxin